MRKIKKSQVHSLIYLVLKKNNNLTMLNQFKHYWNCHQIPILIKLYLLKLYIYIFGISFLEYFIYYEQTRFLKKIKKILYLPSVWNSNIRLKV